MSALILVADADPFNLRLLQEVCESTGHRVVTSGEGGEVLDVVARERPDMILLDHGMPGIDGFEVLRILKTDPVLSRIPVLFVTSGDDVESRRRAIELGAEDYVTKPYLVFEVQQRIRNTLRARMGDREEEETGGPGTAQQLGISLEYELTRAVRYGHALSCVVLRVDEHDRLTDAVGAQWQRHVGDVVMACLRATDQVYLSDADELALVLPETDDRGAQVVAGRVRERLERGASPLPPLHRLRSAHAVYPDLPVEDGASLLAGARRTLTGN